MSEAHVPTQYSSPGQEPRLPSSHVDSRRSRHPVGPAPEGSRPAERLTRPGRLWRLRGRHNIEAARRARRTTGGPVWLRWAPAEAGAVTPPEIGFAIGRRAGTAVARNRLRRRLRAALAALGADLAPGRYLVGAGPEAAGLSFDELTACLRRGLDAAGALRSGRPE
jgi:ribonuclease P protein component